MKNTVCLIENMLDPEAIVIGGSAPPLLIRTILDHMTALPASVRGGMTPDHDRILISEHQGDSSILGAAVLPIYKMLSPLYDVLLQGDNAKQKRSDILGHRSITGAGRL
ncbi:hypothetical protein QGN29_14285 [Temperatibacter marinus]|uniref:Uncharacterized protein n=1 Tax=Temperatibacter marinus TaxID=1456591 RepID=A0AA52EKI6_9PROT|nr:hypothetical protein [Temperatibacter marinus]WND04174.1 hypothetical protein QGN29_14285 [Temperatibacter marinus]